jgi:hypothetical protein
MGIGWLGTFFGSTGVKILIQNRRMDRKQIMKGVAWLVIGVLIWSLFPATGMIGQAFADFLMRIRSAGLAAAAAALTCLMIPFVGVYFAPFAAFGAFELGLRWL